MEGIFAGDQSQSSAIIEIAVDGAHIVNDSHRTFRTRGDRSWVIAHKVQDNSCSCRILFLHALNKVSINKHKLTSLQNSDGQHPGGCCP